MSTAPTLTDGFVTLRGHRADDAQGSYEQCQDPLSQAWTTVPLPYSLDDARTFVGEIMPKGWADDSEWGFAIEVDGQYGGTVSLRPEVDGRAEIAYGSHPRVRGTGTVERALRLLVDWGFGEQGLHTIVWWANKGNWPSRKVAWRLGFSFEGTVRQYLPQRGELRDGWVGTLLRDDPREPRTSWLECPVLEGHGVRLRPMRPTDVPRIVEACADPHTQHWLAQFPRPYTEADAVTYVERVTETHATGGGLTWAVTAGDDALLGSMSLFRLRAGRQAEIGFWTHPDGRGRGLTTAAARLALEHAFGELALQRVTACASEGNLGSMRVLEKNGMRRTGVERRAARTGDGTVLDLVGYDLLAEELLPRT